MMGIVTQKNHQEQSMGDTADKRLIQNRFLTFKLDNEKYGIEILSVKEIIGHQKAIPVHKTPEYVKGVLNLRGQIIPVIDMAIKFGMPEKEASAYTAIIITTIHGTNIGFIVDEVNEVASATEEQLSAPPEFGSTIDVSYISKMAQINKEVIMILNLDNIVDIKEATNMQSLPPAAETHEEGIIKEGTPE